MPLIHFQGYHYHFISAQDEVYVAGVKSGCHVLPCLDMFSVEDFDKRSSIRYDDYESGSSGGSVDTDIRHIDVSH